VSGCRLVDPRIRSCGLLALSCFTLPSTSMSSSPRAAVATRSKHARAPHSVLTGIPAHPVLFEVSERLLCLGDSPLKEKGKARISPLLSRPSETGGVVGPRRHPARRGRRHNPPVPIALDLDDEDSCDGPGCEQARASCGSVVLPTAALVKPGHDEQPAAAEELLAGSTLPLGRPIGSQTRLSPSSGPRRASRRARESVGNRSRRGSQKKARPVPLRVGPSPFTSPSTFFAL